MVWVFQLVRSPNIYPGVDERVVYYNSIGRMVQVETPLIPPIIIFLLQWDWIIMFENEFFIAVFHGEVFQCTVVSSDKQGVVDASSNLLSLSVYLHQWVLQTCIVFMFS